MVMVESIAYSFYTSVYDVGHVHSLLPICTPFVHFLTINDLLLSAIKVALKGSQGFVHNSVVLL